MRCPRRVNNSPPLSSEFAKAEMCHFGQKAWRRGSPLWEHRHFSMPNSRLFLRQPRVCWHTVLFNISPPFSLRCRFFKKYRLVVLWRMWQSLSCSPSFCVQPPIGKTLCFTFISAFLLVVVFFEPGNKTSSRVVCCCLSLIVHAEIHGL